MDYFLEVVSFVALHSRESFQQHPWRRTVHELHTVDVLLAGLYLAFEVSSHSEAAAHGSVPFNNYKNLLGRNV